MGISRGPDTRTDEQKAAASNIGVGYFAHGFGGSCTAGECGQSDGILIAHTEGCKTGQILDAMRRGWKQHCQGKGAIARFKGRRETCPDKKSSPPDRSAPQRWMEALDQGEFLPRLWQADRLQLRA